MRVIMVYSKNNIVYSCNGSTASLAFLFTTVPQHLWTRALAVLIVSLVLEYYYRVTESRSGEYWLCGIHRQTEYALLFTTQVLKSENKV